MKLNQAVTMGIFVLASELFFTAYAKQIPRRYRSANLLGRGDSGISRVQNYDAMFYNPAGISLYQTKSAPLQISSLGLIMFKTLMLGASDELFQIPSL